MDVWLAWTEKHILSIIQQDSMEVRMGAEEQLSMQYRGLGDNQHINLQTRQVQSIANVWSFRHHIHGWQYQVSIIVSNAGMWVL